MRVALRDFSRVFAHGCWGESPSEFFAPVIVAWQPDSPVRSRKFDESQIICVIDASQPPGRGARAVRTA